MTQILQLINLKSTKNLLNSWVDRDFKIMDLTISNVLREMKVQIF